MRILRATLLLTLLLSGTQELCAQQETSHYPAGAEGLKGASLPPPGKYLKWYNIYYAANTIRDRNGKDAGAGLDLDVFATVPRYIWMTDEKVLGADYGMDIAVPFLNVDLKVDAAGVSDSTFGLGDILVEPAVLGWHTDRWDVAAAAGVWAPTGRFSLQDAANPGKGFWTGMFTLGGTYYFDDEKTWHLSALGRYEINSRKKKIDIQPGDDFHIEWGLGKTVLPGLDAGITAYTHWQVTDDRGSAVTYDASVHDRFYPIGPEIVYFHEPAKLFVSFRYQKEFGVVDRPEGHNSVFSFVKIF